MRKSFSSMVIHRWGRHNGTVSRYSLKSAFTLIELLIVVAIVVSLSVAGYLTLSGRTSVAKVESEAQKIAQILELARSQALLKRCMTRVILCDDRQCADPSNADDGSNGGYLTQSSSEEPVRFIAVLRRAQYASEIESCYVPLLSGESPPDDGFEFWDFELRPTPIGQAVELSAIYDSIPGGLGVADWTSITSAEAQDSLWFPRGLTMTSGLNALQIPAFIPITNANDRTNEAQDMIIFFQVKEAGCDPAADEECVAFFAGLSESAQARVQQCVSGGDRGSTRDACH